MGNTPGAFVIHGEDTVFDTFVDVVRDINKNLPPIIVTPPLDTISSSLQAVFRDDPYIHVETEQNVNEVVNTAGQIIGSRPVATIGFAPHVAQEIGEDLGADDEDTRMGAVTTLFNSAAGWARIVGVTPQETLYGAGVGCVLFSLVENSPWWDLFDEDSDILMERHMALLSLLCAGDTELIDKALVYSVRHAATTIRGVVHGTDTGETILGMVSAYLHPDSGEIFTRGMGLVEARDVTRTLLSTIAGGAEDPEQEKDMYLRTHVHQVFHDARATIPPYYGHPAGRAPHGFFVTNWVDGAPVVTDFTRIRADIDNKKGKEKPGEH